MPHQNLLGLVGDLYCFSNTFRMLVENKGMGVKLINLYTREGIRESHPPVHDLQHPGIGKPRRGLQTMDILNYA